MEHNNWNNYWFIYKDTLGFYSMSTNPIFIAEHKDCFAIKKKDIANITKYMRDLNNPDKG